MVNFIIWCEEKIVNDSLPLEKRRRLDKILKIYKENNWPDDPKPKAELSVLLDVGLEATNSHKHYHELWQILICDGYMTLPAMNGNYCLTPAAYRFEGYVKEFNSHLRKRIWGFLNILIPIVVSFVTTILTIKYSK